MCARAIILSVCLSLDNFGGPMETRRCTALKLHSFVIMLFTLTDFMVSCRAASVRRNGRAQKIRCARSPGLRALVTISRPRALFSCMFALFPIFLFSPRCLLFVDLPPVEIRACERAPLRNSFMPYCFISCFILSPRFSPLTVA